MHAVSWAERCRLWQGTLIACSLMIATFESAYTEQNRRRAESRRADLLHGIIASFITLNKSADGTPNLDFASGVSDRLSNDVSEELIMRLGGKARLLARDVPIRLTVSDYVELCEQILSLVTPSCGLLLCEKDIDEAWGDTPGAGVGCEAKLDTTQARKKKALDLLKEVARERGHGADWKQVLAMKHGQSDEDVKQIFDMVDVDSSGLLDREEVALLMQFFSDKDEVSKKEIDKAMRRMDADGSGEVDFAEFLKWWQNRPSSLAKTVDMNVRSMLHSTWYSFCVFAVCCVLWGSLCTLNAGGWYRDSRLAICWACFALLHLDLQFRCKLWRRRNGWTAFWHFPEDFYRQ